MTRRGVRAEDGRAHFGERIGRIEGEARFDALSKRLFASGAPPMRRFVLQEEKSSFRRR